MYLPRKSARPEARVGHGKYASRKLRTAGYTTEAEVVSAAAQAIRDAVLAYQAADDTLNEAIADRDTVDIELDDVAGAVRLALSARGTNAMKEAPYTDIFPNGSRWVLMAPIAENGPRYRDLLARVQRFLPEDDAARVAFESSITAPLDAWTERVTAVETARREVALAGAAIDAAEDAYDRQIEKVAAALTIELGADRVRRYFKRND